MIKKYLLFIFMLLFVLPVSANELQLVISPVQVISTNSEDLEVGDKIKFLAVKDVYLNNKIYISKDSEICGTIDFIHNNGWMGDKAEILVNEFYVRTNEDKNIMIKYPLKISASSKDCKHLKDYFKHYVLGSIRGPEIFIEPDTKIYNIFIER